MFSFPKKILSLPTYEGSFSATELKTDCCNVIFASYEAGKTITTHSHNTDNDGVVLRGEMLLTMNNQDIKVGAGQWYNIPAHIKHAATFKKDTTIIEFWFKPDAVTSCCKKIEG